MSWTARRPCRVGRQGVVADVGDFDGVGRAEPPTAAPVVRSDDDRVVRQRPGQVAARPDRVEVDHRVDGQLVPGGLVGEAASPPRRRTRSRAARTARPGCRGPPATSRGDTTRGPPAGRSRPSGSPASTELVPQPEHAAALQHVVPVHHEQEDLVADRRRVGHSVRRVEGLLVGRVPALARNPTPTPGRLPSPPVPRVAQSSRASPGCQNSRSLF